MHPYNTHIMYYDVLYLNDFLVTMPCVWRKKYYVIIINNKENDTVVGDAVSCMFPTSMAFII